MSRIIKFKAKPKDNNKKLWINFILGEFKGFDHLNLDTISQFTGIMDKNNNEIYENDILEVDYHVYPNCDFLPTRIYGIFEVAFKNARFILMKQDQKVKEETPEKHILSKNNSYGYEIIGNKIDNPEGFVWGEFNEI